MSTYYYFACDECKEYGGWLSRQAWGWGNFDIVDSFQFLTHHISEHGQQAIRIIDEHETYALKQQGWTHIVGADEDAYPDQNERKADYPRVDFPHSGDWNRQKELFARYREQRESSKANKEHPHG